MDAGRSMTSPAAIFEATPREDGDFPAQPIHASQDGTTRATSNEKSLTET
jgi:hypothetical protein